LLRKIIGFLLIAVGVIMLICFMPYWLWLALLGLVLIGAGCYILARRY
jgi:thiol:disulfide interchange protein